MTSQGAPRRREPRTLLEQLIWERNQTLTEFVEWAEEFARRHNESGTLSERHLKRLMSGRKPDGTRIGLPRAATARLLEQIFHHPTRELLTTPSPLREEELELQQRLSTSSRIDLTTVNLLQKQLDLIRDLDRQIGAFLTYEDVLQKIEQVRHLMTFSLSPFLRQALAALLSELGALAGWQSLDLGTPLKSWGHYELAKLAGRESGDTSFEAHADAAQAFILLDAAKNKEALSIIENATQKAKKGNSMLRAWLKGARGDALANNESPSASLREFDAAEKLIREPSDTTPFVLINSLHLRRWRGHVLAKISDNQTAIEVLTSSLDDLGSSYSRAETTLRIDLANALIADGYNLEAMAHIDVANHIATRIGSTRQLRRIQHLAKSVI